MDARTTQHGPRDEDVDEAGRTEADVSARRSEWAQNYIRTHRTRRCVGVFVACQFSLFVCFSMYDLLSDSDPVGRILMSIFSAFPLAVGLVGASGSLRSQNTFPEWLVAWLYGTGIGVLGMIDHLIRSEVLLGLAHGVAGVAVVPILAACLYIPPDSEFEDTVVAPRMIRTSTFGKGQGKHVHLTHYREAEEIAAVWLRRLGYSDAQVTPVGPDGGVDVISLRAVAQVKLWADKRVGIREVQRLVGLAKPGQKSFFFSSSGYTEAAKRWAGNPQHKVALFILGRDGNLEAVNFSAFRAMVTAPVRFPRVNVEPESLKSKLFSGIIPIAGCLAMPIFAVWGLTSPGVNVFGTALLFAVIWTLCLSLFWSVFGRSIRRLRLAIRSYRETGAWTGWRYILQDEPPVRREPTVPPDFYVGYSRSGLSLYLAAIQFVSQCRSVKAWIFSVLHVNRSPRAPFGLGELMATILMESMRPSASEKRRGSRARR